MLARYFGLFILYREDRQSSNWKQRIFSRIYLVLGDRLEVDSGLLLHKLNSLEIKKWI